MDHYHGHQVYCSTTRHGRISDTVEFFPQHCKVPGISSANAATIAAANLTHALQNPTPTTPFKQPGTERMQAIKNLAPVFKEMAPQQAPTPRVDTTYQIISPPPRVDTVPTRKFTTPRVPTILTPHPARTSDAPYRPQRSPRDHNPPQVTQEEWAYQLLATALPKIELAHAVNDTVTGQQLEYRHLLMRPDLKPIWERAFADELGRLAQGIRDVIGTNTIEFIFASEIPQDRMVTYGRPV
jgi:hypothetical protein